MTAFLNVAIVTALCLLLPVTRIYGVIGVGILLYFRPSLTHLSSPAVVTH